MQTEIIYTNSNGESVTFGNEEDLHYFSNELRNYMWGYAERNGHIAAFLNEMKEIDFPVGIFCDNEEQGIKWRNEIYEITDIDVMNETAGVLSIGDWCLDCWVIGSTPDNYWFADQIAEFDLTLLTENPMWYKPKFIHFGSNGESSADSEFLDENYDYEYDYTHEGDNSSVINESLVGANFLIRIYGLAVNPWISIGGDRHEVDCTVPAGSTLEIDSRNKTIQLIDENGNITNAYDDRLLGARGSGYYIFELIKRGYNAITWSNDFNFDLIVYEERSTPEWLS